MGCVLWNQNLYVNSSKLTRTYDSYMSCTVKGSPCVHLHVYFKKHYVIRSRGGPF